MARKSSGVVRVPIGAYGPTYSPGSKRRAYEAARRNAVVLTPEEAEAKSLANQKWAEEQIAKLMSRPIGGDAA